ncbi:MAG TPA: 3'(2'),5'-bisphosphate nucleotidase CysQ [Mycobacteriales bacterium]|nr:3'(2'),5'-bisphosphate nucleotidase CysQ [Mycobacteriales bacterium]
MTDTDTAPVDRLATESDAALAGRLATEAGALLRRIREQLGFSDARTLKDTGDRQSHRFLVAALGNARPADAVLSEEAEDDLARLRTDRVWIVDPLDGTREFGERDRVDWAVHVALWERGDLVAGAVALPAQHVTYSTDSAFSTPPAVPDPIRLVASRSRATELVTNVADRLDAELVPLGSAGAKAMAVVRGDAEAYLHSGGQYEWDSAAPVAVARAAGLHTSRIDGSPLIYNCRDPHLPDLLICHPALAVQVLDVIAAVR